MLQGGGEDYGGTSVIRDQRKGVQRRKTLGPKRKAEKLVQFFVPVTILTACQSSLDTEF